MDSFSYTNIFDTKGIEYIVIIGFLLLLVPFWIILNKKVKFADRIKKVIAFLTDSDLKIPMGVYHSPQHSWVFLERKGNVKVGLDSLVTKLTGEVSVKMLKEPGDSIIKGEQVGEILKDGKGLRLISPISGQLVESNPEISETPECLTQDPYGSGWIYSISPANWKAEVNSYFLAGEASAWMKNELGRFRDFIAEISARNSETPQMAILQDGGQLVENTLETFPEETWIEFEKKFLLTE
ncbi:MAG: hypothetical protein U0W24_08165 [Bacteroidales bacterium]